MTSTHTCSSTAFFRHRRFAPAKAYEESIALLCQRNVQAQVFKCTLKSAQHFFLKKSMHNSVPRTNDQEEHCIGTGDSHKPKHMSRVRKRSTSPVTKDSMIFCMINHFARPQLPKDCSPIGANVWGRSDTYRYHERACDVLNDTQKLCVGPKQA